MNYPLFPLNTVLFPGCMLDLQIFEARYLDMVSTCMRRGEGFGVVTIAEGSEVGEAPRRFSTLGCEALIRDFQQQPNGLLGIRVEGGRRFRVGEVSVQADQLTLGQVTWLAEAGDAPLQVEHADLAALLGALSEHPLVAGLGMGGAVTSQQALANQLAYLLPFAVEQKLQMLGQDLPQQRLELIQHCLDQLQGQ